MTKENRFIENVSRDDARKGWHMDAGPNAMLIQISDPAGGFPDPTYKFKEIHQFEFLDAEDGDRFPDECMIQDEQAVELVRLLQHALDNAMNVVVHCHAGICRSGAVVEVGVMMGFTPTDRFRQPNLRVKHRMMKALGWTYDSAEKHSSTGGYISNDGIWLPNNFGV
jgi:rhodanese-related sulfurtransferase